MFLSYNDGTLRTMWDGPPSLTTEHVGYDGLLGDGGNADAGVGGVGGGGKAERLGPGESGRLSGPGEMRRSCEFATSKCLFVGALFGYGTWSCRFSFYWLHMLTSRCLGVVMLRSPLWGGRL